MNYFYNFITNYFKQDEKFYVTRRYYPLHKDDPELRKWKQECRQSGKGALLQLIENDPIGYRVEEYDQNNKMIKVEDVYYNKEHIINGVLNNM